MTSQIRVYLDTNTLSDLLTTSGGFNYTMPALRRRVRAGQVQVFGSAKHFEELGGLAKRDPHAYSKIVDRSLKLMGRYILNDRAVLCALESRRGEPLTVGEACASKRLVADFQAFVRSSAEAHEIAVEVSRDHEDYRKQFVDATSEALEEMASGGLSPRGVLRDIAGNWTVTRESVDDWLASADWIKELGIEPERLPAMEMPVLRSWFAYAIAHAHKSVLEGRRIDAADKGDWEHYGYAAIPGTLVTNDRKFKRIAEHIDLNHVRVISTAEFVASLR